MITSTTGIIFRVTGPLCEEFTSQRLIPLTKASDVERLSFLLSAPEQTVDQIIKAPVNSDDIALIMTVTVMQI